MELTQKLGDKIIREVRKLIHEDIIIVNKQAVIIASTEPARIGHYHEGADYTIQNKKTMIITEEDEQRLKGVKAGINLPITIQEQVLGVIGITGNPDEVAPFGSLMKKMTELLIKESIYIQEVEWKERMAKTLLNRAEVLGIVTNHKKRCILIRVEDSTDDSISNIIMKAKRWLEQQTTGVVTKWKENQLLLLLDCVENQSEIQIKKYMENFYQFAENDLHTNVSIGIGNEVNFKSLVTSYMQAKKALKAKSHSIVFYNDLLLDIILADVKENSKDVFIHRVFEPIRNDAVLIQTLKTYVQNNLHLKTTAEHLHIHINTLHYRLKKIYELTNLDPKSTESIVIFYLGLQLLDEYTKNKK